MTDQEQPPYVTSYGYPPTLDQCVEVEAFTPPEKFLQPGDTVALMAEGKNAAGLYGTPLSHHAQQLTALWYAQSKIGFDAAIKFKVHWKGQRASWFAYGADGSWSEV